MAGPTEPGETNQPDTTAGDGETTQSVPEFPGDTTAATCPPFDSAQQVVCYEAVDPEAMPLVLVPETQTIQPGRATDFTLRNRSGQGFDTNFYHWQLYKRVDGEWYYILPQSWPIPLTPLEAGEDHTWTLTVTTGRVSDGQPIEYVQATDSLTVAGLGGGQYAFGTDGSFSAGSQETSVAVAAGFELHTDRLQITPTAAIEGTEWDGDTLVARSTRGEPDDESERPDAYILERIDDTETEAREVIAEQVVRNTQLRDAIALSREHDADRVRLEEYSYSIPPFGLNEARTYEFREDRYRVTATKGGSS